MQGRESRRRIASLIAVAGLAAAVPAIVDAQAQAYPNRPVRLVLAFGAPGGAPDTIARSLGPRLTEAWGQQVVVDPRTGAGGTIATDIVAKAPADGYTILLASPSHAINTSLYRKLPYDSIRDFAPISQVADVPNILSVHPSVPARTVKDLIAVARAKPGTLNYGSAGSGSSQHLAGELFAKMAGVSMVHVPYKGGGAVVIDLVSGQVQLTFGSATSLPHIRAGRIIALGITSAKRSPNLPDLPTIAETALPGYEASAWYGFLAPARTPPAIVAKLQEAIARALREPDVRDRFAFMTIDPVGSTPEAFAKFLVAETTKWGALVKESGARVD